MDDKLYALSAMCQAAQLALQLAINGTCELEAFQVHIESLFTFDPKEVKQIYGDFHSLKLGNAYLNLVLRNPLKYYRTPGFILVRSFFVLAKIILRSPSIQKKLLEQLSRIKEQISYFGSIEHARVIENLSDTYLELASHSQLRLKVAGHKKHLENLELINKIRVLLFSGVRAAVLWYQLGGNVTQLFWHRKAWIKQTKETLSFP